MSLYVSVEIDGQKEIDDFVLNKMGNLFNRAV